MDVDKIRTTEDVNKEDSTGTGEINKQNEWPHAASSANMHAEGSHRQRICDAARKKPQPTEDQGGKGGRAGSGEKGDVMRESNQPFDGKIAPCIKMIITKRMDGIVPQLPYTQLVKIPPQISLLMCLVPRKSKIRTKDVKSSLQDQDVRRRRDKDQRCPPKDEDLKRRVSKTKDVKDNSVVLLMSTQGPQDPRDIGIYTTRLPALVFACTSPKSRQADKSTSHVEFSTMKQEDKPTMHPSSSSGRPSASAPRLGSEHGEGGGGASSGQSWASSLAGWEQESADKGIAESAFKAKMERLADKNSISRNARIARVPVLEPKQPLCPGQIGEPAASHRLCLLLHARDALRGGGDHWPHSVHFADRSEQHESRRTRRPAAIINALRTVFDPQHSPPADIRYRCEEPFRSCVSAAAGIRICLAPQGGPVRYLNLRVLEASIQVPHAHFGSICGSSAVLAQLTAARLFSSCGSINVSENSTLATFDASDRSTDSGWQSLATNPEV
ncbi:hypothetical protein B0H13DRAFT_1925264 [Mycena leptocephala]|nr:hypothetical protein B0H13DRAFT_1925264 [Mycena leptocephala]